MNALPLRIREAHQSPRQLSLALRIRAGFNACPAEVVCWRPWPTPTVVGFPSESIAVYARPRLPSTDREVPSSEVPTGVGEPPVLVISPAVVNALARLTGNQYRRLPLVAVELQLGYYV